MIYIFGDSHARFSFNRLQHPHVNLQLDSITMHRIGRDGVLPNQQNMVLQEDSIVLFTYGEIDCRCHIYKQRELGRDIHEVMDVLVEEYFACILKNIRTYRAIIVCGIIPPSEIADYETYQLSSKNLEYPFIGTDQERAYATAQMNQRIQQKCESVGFYYFYPYTSYIRENGCLRYEYSDHTVHIHQNERILQEFNTFISDFI